MIYRIFFFFFFVSRISTSSCRETADGLVKRRLRLLSFGPLYPPVYTTNVRIQRGVAIGRGLRSLQAHDLSLLPLSSLLLPLHRVLFSLSFLSVCHFISSWPKTYLLPSPPGITRQSNILSLLIQLIWTILLPLFYSLSFSLSPTLLNAFYTQFCARTHTLRPGPLLTSAPELTGSYSHGIYTNIHVFYM